MLTETSNLNEKLDQGAAARRPKRNNKNGKCFEVPKEVQEKIKRGNIGIGAVNKPVPKMKYPKPIRDTKYRTQTLSEYYQEEFEYAANYVLYYKFNNIDFDELYNDAYHNGILAIKCGKSVSDEKAKERFDNCVNEFYENNKTKYL